MAAELRWRPQAREDLLEIYERIAIDNLDAADQFLARIQGFVFAIDSTCLELAAVDWPLDERA